MKILSRISNWAAQIKTNLVALYYAYKHPLVSKLIKFSILTIIGYAVSPIDLVPDFIPIIGLLDDLLLLPTAIWIIIKMIQPEIWAKCKHDAMIKKTNLPKSKNGLILILTIWFITIFSIVYFIIKKN